MQTSDKNEANPGKITRTLPWIAVLAVLLAGSLLSHTLYFYLTAHQTTCTVLAVETLRGSGTSSSLSYRPTIQYTDDKGVSHVVDFQVAANYYNYSVGQNVAILYNPNDPQAVRFNTFMGVWGLTGGGVIVAVVLVLIALAQRAVHRQTQREKALDDGRILGDDPEQTNLL